MAPAVTVGRVRHVWRVSAVPLMVAVARALDTGLIIEADAPQYILLLSRHMRTHTRLTADAGV
jgi:hypothetical protein